MLTWGMLTWGKKGRGNPGLIVEVQAQAKSRAAGRWNKFLPDVFQPNTHSAASARSMPREHGAPKEKMMIRAASYLAFSASLALLISAGPVSAQTAPGYGYYSRPAAGAYGSYPSDYAPGYYNYPSSSSDMGPFSFLTAPLSVAAAPLGAAAAAPAMVAGAATAPLTMGRSVAEGQMGGSCTTPVKSCRLHQASFIGNGCSCKVTGGRSRGTVSP